jgi:polyribonucleotide nucleotidyltransferase
MVLASDRQNDADVLAMNCASAALCVSPLPFQGPIGSLRLGLVDGQFIPFPTQDALEESELDLIVSGSKDVILMIEGFAREMPEERMAEALEVAHDYIRQLCQLQEELCRKVGVQKATYEPVPSDGIFEKLKSRFYADFKAAKQTSGKHARADAVSALKERVVKDLIPDPEAADAIKASSLDRAGTISNRMSCAT